MTWHFILFLSIFRPVSRQRALTRNPHLLVSWPFFFFFLSPVQKVEEKAILPHSWQPSYFIMLWSTLCPVWLTTASGPVPRFFMQGLRFNHVVNVKEGNEGLALGSLWWFGVSESREGRVPSFEYRRKMAVGAAAVAVAGSSVRNEGRRERKMYIKRSSWRWRIKRVSLSLLFRDIPLKSERIARACPPFVVNPQPRTAPVPCGRSRYTMTSPCRTSAPFCASPALIGSSYLHFRLGYFSFRNLVLWVLIKYKMAEQKRFRFGRSLSERWRRSTTSETVERIWMRLRQVTLQGKCQTQKTWPNFSFEKKTTKKRGEISSSRFCVESKDPSRYTFHFFSIISSFLV